MKKIYNNWDIKNCRCKYIKKYIEYFYIIFNVIYENKYILS